MNELPPNAPIRADLAEIQRATDRAAGLTRQLLSFARRQRLEMRPLNVNELIDNLEKLLRRLIGEHIRLVTDLAPDLGLITADPGQIEQVLVNLVVNARDAMPSGGVLTIGAANVTLDPHSSPSDIELPAGEYVLLTVTDNGVSIPPEVRPHLFEPFFTTKPKGQGTGLGLATSYGIIKQHGGSIWIYSELGYGTVVKIYLPRNYNGVIKPTLVNEAFALSSGTETVLLAEDEPAVRAFAARLLRDAGYVVLEAVDGEQAVELAAAYAPRPIHLLLTDVVMPGLGGLAAAKQIKDIYPAARIICMSGYTSLADTPNAINIEGLPLLQKPFSPASLLKYVRAELDRQV